MQILCVVICSSLPSRLIREAAGARTASRRGSLSDAGARRLGVEVEGRWEILPWLFADADACSSGRAAFELTLLVGRGRLCTGRAGGILTGAPASRIRGAPDSRRGSA
jgi:hypothetical protein